MKASTTAKFNSPVQKVWDAVTDHGDISWRKDLDDITFHDESSFIERAKNGFATTFSVSLKQPDERYELDMSNANMSGRRTYLFSPHKNGTYMRITEEVFVQDRRMGMFAILYLKKRQKEYTGYLSKRLGE